MGIRAWTSETSTACAEFVSLCWNALWRLMHNRFDAGHPPEQESDNRLDTAIETSHGRLSLNLDWNTMQQDATFWKEIPKEIADTASEPPNTPSFRPDTALLQADADADADADGTMILRTPTTRPDTALKGADKTAIPKTPSTEPGGALVEPDKASVPPEAICKPDIARPRTPVENKRDSRHLPELFCFSDTPIPTEANVIENGEGVLQRHASQRITFMQTGLDFGSAVDLPTTTSNSAEPSPNFHTSFQQPPDYQNSPQQQHNFQYSPQPQHSFQHSSQLRTSLNYTNPFDRGQASAYRSPSPLPQHMTQPRFSLNYSNPFDRGHTRQSRSPSPLPVNTQARTSLQAHSNPFDRGGPPSYRSSSPLPVYLQWQDSLR